MPEPYIAVLPHKRLTGQHQSPWLWTPPATIANPTDTLPGEVLPLRAALERRWATDAHLVTYVVHDGAGAPVQRQVRLVKGELADVRAHGLAVLHYVRMADVDTIPHDTHLTADQLADIVHRAEGRGLAIYPTTKGFRVVASYETAVTPETHEHHLPEFLARLVGIFGDGYQVDDNCRDWTRVFRLPRVVRADEQTCYSTLADMYYLDAMKSVAVEPYTPPPPPPQELPPNSPVDPDVVHRAARYVEAIPTPACGTSSCDAVTYQVAHELAKGFALPVDEALPILEAWAGRGAHGWKEGDLRRKLEEAQTAPTTTGYRLHEADDLKYRADHLSCDDIFDERDLDAYLRGPRWERDSLGFGSEPELRDAVLRNLTHGHPEHVVFTRSQLFRYRPATGVWEGLRDSEVISDVTAYDLTPVQVGTRSEHVLQVNNSKARGVLSLLKDARDVPTFFDNAPVGVGFQNGVLSVDVTTGELALKEHSPENRLRYAYPFPYAPGAPKPERYARLILRAARDLSTRDKADTFRLLLEHLGASLVGLAPRFERALVLWGDGGTGNSTIVKVHAGCMPPGSVGSTSPSSFEDKFHRAQLDGRLLNAVDDLPKDEMKNAGPWKSIITGGPIEAAHKNKPPFTFCCVAGQLWACNEPPPVADTGHAFRRRTIVLRFTSKLDESEKRRDMAEHVLAERASIVHHALSMLSQAIARNGLTIPPHSQAHLDEWIRNSDAKEVFFEEELVVLKPEQRGQLDLWMPAILIYQHYVRWCEAKGHKPCSDTKLGTWLRDRLGIKAAEAQRVPFKRTAGKFYPVYFASVAKDVAQGEEAAERINQDLSQN